MLRVGKTLRLVVAIMVLATALMFFVAEPETAKAESCTWVSGTIGNVYTDFYHDVWYTHRAFFVWNGDAPPDVDSVYYYVNNEWIYITPTSIITYDGNPQIGPNSGWWGYYIDTTATIINPWFNGEQGNWNDDWRWGAYINCS